MTEQTQNSETVLEATAVEVKETPKRKIAIFGTTPSRVEGPWQDNSGWERWTIGPGGKDAHGWERLFEVHGTWPADFADYLNDLSNVKPPRQVFMLPQPSGPARTWKSAVQYWRENNPEEAKKVTGDWSAVVPYPREFILERFHRRMWFSSSIAWCIALAMVEPNVSDIGLWGIDLESGEEYISQFAGCAHFLDLAVCLGFNVHLPRDSGLTRDVSPYPDRYETHLSLTFEKKAKWIQQHLSKMEPEYENLKADVHRQEGLLLGMRNLGAKPEDMKEAERILIANSTRLGQLAANVNQLKGELGATNFYRRMYTHGMIDPNEPVE